MSEKAVVTITRWADEPRRVKRIDVTAGELRATDVTWSQSMDGIGSVVLELLGLDVRIVEEEGEG
jgi:hypothetical protein